MIRLFPVCWGEVCVCLWGLLLNVPGPIMLQLEPEKTAGAQMKGWRLRVLTFRPPLEKREVFARARVVRREPSIAQQTGKRGFKQRVRHPARLLGTRR